MKRWLGVLLCLGLLIPAAPVALAAEEPLWTCEEEGGGYVTVRLPCPQGEGMKWSEQSLLSVRYRDTGEPVPLTSGYIRGFLFATVPVEQADRPLEVFQGERREGTDLDVARLMVRGLLSGDPDGDLRLEDSLTWGEALAVLDRFLTRKPEGAPACTHRGSHGWYCGYVAAARTAGLLDAPLDPDPAAPITRAELTVLLARAWEQLGWLQGEPAAGEELEVADREDIPDWALDSYRKLAPYGGIWAYRETGQLAGDGAPVMEAVALAGQEISRGEAMDLIDGFCSRPWYPNQLAIDLGLDRGDMPVIDGSTSSYPFTAALYGTLFRGQHPRMPAEHSKSHQSYERLIQGEADLLFAATLPSAQLLERAAEAGVELECIPIGYDAMVFFTNRENSATGLTRAQIQDIYVRGIYDNWGQVGGPDAELLPYRRNSDSGSHALMERYFLEGGALSLSPDVHNVLTSYAMSSALTDVALAMEEEPPAYAMGYSLYYYYQNNYWVLDDVTDRELKLLAIDGVAPTEESIRDGSYPLADHCYVVIRADEGPDSPARRVAQFMLTEAGQAVVESAGFGRLTPGA